MFDPVPGKNENISGRRVKMVRTAITGAGNDQAAGALSAAGAKPARKSEFSAIMAKSLNSQAGVKNASGKVSADAVKGSQPKQDVKQDVKQDSGLTSAGVKAEDKNRPEQSGAVKDGGENSSAAQAETGSKMEAAAQDVAEKLKDELGITDEQLQEAMSALGLTMLDLLNPSNVTKVAMQAAGVQDAVELVTDGELSSALKNILDFVNQRTAELADELHIPAEELQNAVNQAKAENAYADPQSADANETDDSSRAEDSSIAKAVSQEKGTQTESSTAAQEEPLMQAVSEKLTTHRENAGGQQQGNRPGDSGIGNVPANVTQQVAHVFEQAFQPDTASVNPADIVRQVIDAVRLTSTQSLQSIEIQLSPESLGKVNVMVSVREGVITAQITAQNEQVRQALENQLVVLKENFENQGIKVEAVEVTVQSHGFEANQNFTGREQEQGSHEGKRRLRPEELRLFEDGEQDAEVQDVLPVNENSSVEYTA